MTAALQEIIFFAGNANKPLAQKIAAYLDIPLGKALVGQFADGETRVEIETNVRGRDVFILQPTCRPANQHIMEAVIMADACRRASAENITLVAPYFGYGRQERKSAPRTPISAKLVADLFEASGITRLLTVELHTSAIQGFFNVPVDHLFAKPVFFDYFKNKIGPENNLIIISPDAGGVERSRALAKLFNCGLAIVDKRRDQPNESSVMHIIGEVKGKFCLIVDDICDTGGSLTKAADALMSAGAEKVSAVICHPVFSSPAVERIAASSLDEVLVTDSIPLAEDALKCSKIRQLSLAQLLGKAMRRIHNSESVSSLFI